MQDYFQHWLDMALAEQPRRFAEPVVVTGKISKQLGPYGGAFAYVTFELTTAPAFEVVDESGPHDEDNVSAFVDYAIFGFLDVALSAGYFPVSRTRIIIRDLRYHLVDSNRQWFRMAGREAARQVLADRPDLTFEPRI